MDEKNSPQRQPDLEAQQHHPPAQTLEQAQSGALEDARKQEEGALAPLTELAVPRPAQNDEEQGRRREEYLLREEGGEEDEEGEEGEEGESEDVYEGGQELTSVLSEVAVPPPVQHDPSHLRPEWTALESAESRVSSVPSHHEVALAQGEKPLSALATQVYIVAYLVFFSILGALARLGMQALTVYPGTPVTMSVLWANVAGCFVMGFLSEDRNLFQQEWSVHGQASASNKPENGPSLSSPPTVHKDQSHAAHKAIKKTIPLYIGLTTGFCGSFTSFSTFILDVFLALSNDLPYPNPLHQAATPRNGGYSFMAVLAVILITVSLSMSALHFGAHLALFCDPYTPTLPFHFMRKILDRAIVVLAVGCWLGAIFLAIWPPDRHKGVGETWRGRAVFALVFAPLGCLTRFYVSLLLNARVPKFPLGTFVANMLGTAVLGMCFDLQHSTTKVLLGSPSAVGGGGGVVSIAQLTGCQVLRGVMDGFCGALTTVSTWVAEVSSLRLGHAYRYGTVSVGAALAVLVVVIGPVRWGGGFGEAVC
ncbi:hypothetical protein AJ80_09033 [Polytolypa hystricis UAMH7299]|uniref:Chromosome condensation protein n=1 Tax=Polytolypa hystricis (strain UAMH7299) TaxID=1447883 RepID=A0A2B7WXD1_POLH7|nr:hypothetical protein AJ80_09033 [Polytolypa hystricis UAMH7299]